MPNYEYVTCNLTVEKKLSVG